MCFGAARRCTAEIALTCGQVHGCADVFKKKMATANLRTLSSWILGAWKLACCRLPSCPHPKWSPRASVENFYMQWQSMACLFQLSTAHVHHVSMLQRTKKMRRHSSHSRAAPDNSNPNLPNVPNNAMIHRGLRLHLCNQSFCTDPSWTALLSPPFRSSPQVTAEPSFFTAVKAQVAPDSWHTSWSWSWRLGTEEIVIEQIEPKKGNLWYLWLLLIFVKTWGVLRMPTIVNRHQQTICPVQVVLHCKAVTTSACTTPAHNWAVIFECCKGIGRRADTAYIDQQMLHRWRVATLTLKNAQLNPKAQNSCKMFQGSR